jgi:threonine synthase
VETLSNAMDVSKPNNWPRIEYMMDSGQFNRDLLTGLAVDETTTADTLKHLYQLGYISEPHAAVAYRGLQDSLIEGEVGIFLGTAHPAKFKSTVESILNIELPLPAAIAACAELPDLSQTIAPDFMALKYFLTA